MNYESMGIETEEDLAQYLYSKYEQKSNKGIRELTKLTANLFYRIIEIEWKIQNMEWNMMGEDL